jgi:hypothetical protein
VITRTAASTARGGWNSAAGEPPAPRDDPPRRPGRPEEVQTGAGAGSSAGDLPLHHDIAAHEPTVRVEEPAQQGRSAMERRVGDHPVGVAGSTTSRASSCRTVTVGVAANEPLGQVGDHARRRLDGEDVGAWTGQRLDEHPAARAELDDPVLGADPGLSNQAGGERRPSQEVLPAVAPRRPGDPRWPGHGSSRPSPYSSRC